MIKNRIKERLVDQGISQVALTRGMPEEITQVVMSFIVTGKVLPTRECLQVMCDMLDCKPTDLYQAEDLNLLYTGEIALAQEDSEKKDTSQHEGMIQLRAWLRPQEKESITRAVDELGYRNVAEWLREMVRNTVERNKLIQAGIDPDHTESNHPS